MKKNLREQLSLQEQKDLLKGIIDGKVQTTLDIVNALPCDLKASGKKRLVAMFERALPSMSYVKNDSKYIGVFETPEQVVERLEARMNEILRQNKLNNVNARHMWIEKNRLQAELSEYMVNGGTDTDHLATAKKEIEDVERVIRQLFDDSDLILIEYSELSSIKNKMVDILNEK